MYIIYINDEKFELENQITYYEIVNMFKEKYENDILLVNVNGQTKELNALCKNNDRISFIFYDNPLGREAYIRTALFILFKSVFDVIDNEFGKQAILRFTQNDAYFISANNYEYTDLDIENIKKRVNELISKKIKIEKIVTSTNFAIKYSKNKNLNDIEFLFKYRLYSNIKYYKLENYVNYYYDHLLYDTSYIKYYNILKYKSGIIISFPDINNIKIPISFKPINRVFETQIESLNWTTRLNTNTVGFLNEKIAKNEFNDLIIMQESFQEKKIGEIANKVFDSKKKIIFIAGPTSSGKTTFSHRLSYHIKALGLNPITLSVDNFFIDRQFSPRDENGDYDFESLENVDLKYFNDFLIKLLNGEKLLLPKFNFITGKREFKNEYTKLNQNDILIIEGIHSLNNKMSYAINNDEKFNIYISALTQIAIDNHNRISTSDFRLIRRIVRDNRERGFNAQDTIRLWDKVQNGEMQNIFPYQENANVIFNSSLVYELSILKIYVEPLLFNIDRDSVEFITAKRLLKILSFFLAGTENAIPKYSIIREFIGNSILNIS